MNIEVKNSRDEVMWSADGIDPSMTVDLFKKKFAAESTAASKSNNMSFDSILI